MDSLTQITLGAAVGELVAGKKLGNRAMLWGAVAGTIPDLDVIIGSLFMDDLRSLAFHRGFMHSFTFAILFSFVMTFLTLRIYNTNYYQKSPHKITAFSGAILMMLFMAGILNLLPVVAGGSIYVPLLIISIILFAFFIYRLYKNYLRKKPLESVQMSSKHWYIFFLLTIVTHPILDCFTTYGTQLFQPFSKLRVAWDNISVFDPAYTAPFLICLLIAAFLKKGSNWRMRFNIAGIVLSSIYMVWTFNNKNKVNQVFESSLKKQEIPYNRFLTTPTIANNLLWNCVAETDSLYYTGFYSILDKEPVVKNMLIVPIRKDIVSGHEKDESIETLQWFSNGYNSYLRLENGSIQVNDMRYGRFTTDNEKPDNFIFKFTLVENEKGELILTESVGGPPDNESDWLTELFERIKGI